MPPRNARGRSRSRGGPRTRSHGETRDPTPPRTTVTSGEVNMEQMNNLIAQQIAAAVPTIVAQINTTRNDGNNGSTRNDGNENRDRPENSGGNLLGCTYKSFMSCKPMEFHGNEGTIKALRWIDEMEAILDISKCAEEDKVRFVSHSLKSEALEWWNYIIKARGRNEANRMPWMEFTKLMIDKYCPINEMEKLQTEFLSLSMDGKNIMKYTQRFNALSRLLPNLVTPESQMVNRYIWGLDSRIRGLVKASQPVTMKSAIELAAIVTDDRIRSGEFDSDRSSIKRKAGDDVKHVVYAANGPERKKGRNDQRKKDVETKTKLYQGILPWCVKCSLHHQGTCDSNVCFKCKSPGHMARYCRVSEARKCYECGSLDHLRNACPELGKSKKQHG